MAPTPQPVTDPLTLAALDAERYVAAAGWDQPLRLFALVPTARLAEELPGFADTLKPHERLDGALSAVEQEGLPAGDGIEEVLGQVAWPEEVEGTLMAVERIVLPPTAEVGMPDDPDDAMKYLAGHPERSDVRLVVAVTRDGRSRCLLRQRAHDQDDAVAQGDDIAPGLVHALAATLAD